MFSLYCEVHKEQVVTVIVKWSVGGSPTCLPLTHQHGSVRFYSLSLVGWYHCIVQHLLCVHVQLAYQDPMEAWYFISDPMQHFLPGSYLYLLNMIFRCPYSLCVFRVCYHFLQHRSFLYLIALYLCVLNIEKLVLISGSTTLLIATLDPLLFDYHGWRKVKERVTQIMLGWWIFLT